MVMQHLSPCNKKSEEDLFFNAVRVHVVCECACTMQTPSVKNNDNAEYVVFDGIYAD